MKNPRGQFWPQGKQDMPKQYKIMLVEDEKDLVEVYSIKLQASGFLTASTSDSVEALKVAEKEKPDLILLDLVMPGIDGYTVLSQLKSSAKLKNALVWVWSNLTQNHEIEMAKDKGADGYIIKSDYTPTQLVAKINEILKIK